jgi:hypothetical protein
MQNADCKLIPRVSAALCLKKYPSKFTAKLRSYPRRLRTGLYRQLRRSLYLYLNLDLCLNLNSSTLR